MRQTKVSHARRILVVEDDHDIRQLLTELLAAEGYETRGASDGPEALALVEGWWPDVVILEPRLPNGDRRSIVGKPSASSSRTRTAALSAGSLRLDCSVVLTRPFDVDALMAALESAALAE
jgi:CheY-like chemotaxis protein